MIRNYLLTLGLLFILLSPFNHVFALDVYQTIDLSKEGEHPYLSNHLRAGDTICSGSMIPDTNVGGKIATINEVSDDQKATFFFS